MIEQELVLAGNELRPQERPPDLTVRLPGEPKGKGRPQSRIATKRDGSQFVHVYTDAETRSYEGMLRLAAERAMGSQSLFIHAVRLRMTATFSPPQSWSSKRQREANEGLIRPVVKPDCDNLLKVIDALTGVVWLDDKIIVECIVRKFYGVPPSLVIEVWEQRGTLL